MSIHFKSSRCSLFKYVALIGAFAGISGAAQSQTLITDSDFFDPDFRARRPGSESLLLSLAVDTTLYTPSSQSAGNVSWTHSAGGLVQIGADAGLLGTADVQLAAYTETIGDALVFGRELDVTTTGTLGILSPTVQALVDEVVGASAVNSWEAAAVATSLNVVQGQLYSVQFDVQTGAGINLNALSYANFRLLNGGNAIHDTNTSEFANLLDLLQLGGGLAAVQFDFVAPDDITELEFQFEAATIADVSLLGTIEDNQTVLQFSNFSLTLVPEPAGPVLLVVAWIGFAGILRRRR